MIIGNVMGATNGSVPLPEGINPSSPFATKHVHPLSTPKFEMLEHPCAHIRALEHLFGEFLSDGVKRLKEQFGLENIEHMVLTKDENGDKKTIPLVNNFVSTYWGLFSLICGTSLPQNFKQLFPNTNYPIGYTPLNTSSVIFRKHVPVCTNGNHFVPLAHCLHYTVDQELKKRFIYSLIPFIDQDKRALPILYLSDSSKLSQQLKEIIEKKGINEVQLNWDTAVSEFSNNLSRALANDPTMFEPENPITQLYESLNSQVDSLSLSRAIALLSSNSQKVMLSIVPEHEIMLQMMPPEPSEVRKQMQELARKQAELQATIGRDNSISDLAALL